jgi:hypothetical protein
MIIKRTLNPGNFVRFQADFAFLQKLIAGSQGTLDLAIRDNYLNLYYRGYSLARIQFKKNRQYEVRVHEKFWKGPLAKHKKINSLTKKSGSYVVANVSQKDLHPFFQRAHLDRMFSAIKTAGTSEELVFEQMLISDNLERKDFLIIDRQITDKVFKGRMDLLALRKVKGKGNQYQFVVLEVKMGNNLELSGDVAKQLSGYNKHIEANFGDYKKCYEEHYRQKKAFGLFSEPSFSTIDIVSGVDGVVVVGGYSVQATKAIDQLKAKKKGISVQAFKNKIK